MAASSYEVIEGVARFRLTGPQVLRDAVLEVADAIVRTKDLGLSKLLVDISTITGVETPSLDTRFWLMGVWAHAGRSAVRVALVTRPEFVRADRIGVVVGLNQGFVSDVFETETQALDWLLERYDRGRSPSPPPA